MDRFDVGSPHCLLPRPESPGPIQAGSSKGVGERMTSTKSFADVVARLLHNLLHRLSFIITVDNVHKNVNAYDYASELNRFYCFSSSSEH